MIYLYLGPEEGEKQTELDKNIKKIKEKDETTEIRKYFGGENEGEEALSFLTIPSFFSTHTVAIFKHYENENKNGSLYKALSLYLKDPSSKNESSDLFLLSIEQNPQNLPPEFSSYLKNAKTQEVNSLVKVQKFFELNDSEKRTRIVNLAKKEGYLIEGKAVTEILNSVDNSSQEILEVVNRIISFLRVSKKEIKEIKAEDIERYQNNTKTESGYTLFKALSERDLEHSLLILASLYRIDQRSILPAFSVISSQFRILESALEMKEKGISENEIFRSVNPVSIYSGPKKIGIPYPAQSTFHTALSKYSLKEVKEIILYLSEMDEKIKSVSGELSIIFYELVIYRIIEGKKETEYEYIKAPELGKKFF